MRVAVRSYIWMASSALFFSPGLILLLTHGSTPATAPVLLPISIAMIYVGAIMVFVPFRSAKRHRAVLVAYGIPARDSKDVFALAETLKVRRRSATSRDGIPGTRHVYPNFLRAAILRKATEEPRLATAAREALRRYYLWMAASATVVVIHAFWQIWLYLPLDATMKDWGAEPAVAAVVILLLLAASAPVHRSLRNMERVPGRKIKAVRLEGAAVIVVAAMIAGGCAANSHTRSPSFESRQ